MPLRESGTRCYNEHTPGERRSYLTVYATCLSALCLPHRDRRDRTAPAASAGSGCCAGIAMHGSSFSAPPAPTVASRGRGLRTRPRTGGFPRAPACVVSPAMTRETDLAVPPQAAAFPLLAPRLARGRPVARRLRRRPSRPSRRPAARAPRTPPRMRRSGHLGMGGARRPAAGGAGHRRAGAAPAAGAGAVNDLLARLAAPVAHSPSASGSFRQGRKARTRLRFAVTPSGPRSRRPRRSRASTSRCSVLPETCAYCRARSAFRSGRSATRTPPAFCDSARTNARCRRAVTPSAPRNRSWTKSIQATFH